MEPVKDSLKKRKKEAAEEEVTVDQNVFALPASSVALSFFKRKRKPKPKQPQQQQKQKQQQQQQQEQQRPQEEQQDWFDGFLKKINGPLSNPTNFGTLESFLKISRKTYDYICSLVKEEMMCKQLNITGLDGNPLCINDQVAIALRRLSSGESLSNIGDLFGINQSAVSNITWRFIEAMEEKGLHHLQWPSTESEMDRIKSKFKKLRGLPNCCGTVDITHILMTLPATDGSNAVWIDREKKHSMVLQAIVDPDLKFLDVVIGYPGSLTDAMVFQDSRFYKLCEEGKRLDGNKVETSNGSEVREYIIGDSGFPLLPWLITPYQSATPGYQIAFNKRHSVTRMVARAALARLKERWRILHGVMWLPDKNRLPRIIFVCCLLHNIVIDMNDKVSNETASSPPNHDPDYRQQTCKSADETGRLFRENLALSLSKR